MSAVPGSRRRPPASPQAAAGGRRRELSRRVPASPRRSTSARWGEDLGLFEIGRDYPRLAAHLGRLAADPAVVFAHAVKDGRPATTSGRCLGHVSLAGLEPRLLAA